MSSRIVTNHERMLTTTFNDIEYIESQSLQGIGIIKIYFQPGTDIRIATSQVTSASQTVLRQMSPEITPAADPQLQRFACADPATGIVGQGPVRTAAFR